MVYDVGEKQHDIKIPKHHPKCTDAVKLSPKNAAPYLFVQGFFLTLISEHMNKSPPHLFSSLVFNHQRKGTQQRIVVQIEIYIRFSEFHLLPSDMTFVAVRYILVRRR